MTVKTYQLSFSGKPKEFTDRQNYLPQYTVEEDYSETLLQILINMDSRGDLESLIQENQKIISEIANKILGNEDSIWLLSYTLGRSWYLNESDEKPYKNLNLVKYKLVKILLEHGFDPSKPLYDPDGDETTWIQAALENDNFELAELFIKHGAGKNMTLSNYVPCGDSFESHVFLVERFPNIFDPVEFTELARSFGMSYKFINSFIETHNFTKDYADLKNGIKKSEFSLSPIELSILDANTTEYDIENFKNANLENPYGYTLLHLAVMAQKYSLANELVLNGFDLYTESKAEITPIFQIANLYEVDNQEFNTLAKTAIKLVDNIDAIDKSGTSLIDGILDNEEVLRLALEKSNDPLISLFKESADLFMPSQEPEFTHIGISHGDWSAGINEAARLVMKNHPNVKFHLVNKDMIETLGFIEQFDAFINPGAGDSFPKLEEFTKEDWNVEERDELEHLYQSVLDKTLELNIPYFGMCAGAQNFALYHGGTIKPIEGYSQGQHEIYFNQESLPYFLTLTQEEQDKVLATCEMPEVLFKGDTAHHYAAIPGQLGDGMKLGATSEDATIAMSYAHENGIRFATQFHPEHYYNSDSENGARQHNMLENFVKIAIQHHDARFDDNIVDPQLIYPLIQERLEECISHPTSIAYFEDDQCPTDPMFLTDYWDPREYLGDFEL